MRFRGRVVVALLIALLVAAPLGALRAQSNSGNIVLQVAIPSANKDAFSDKLLGEFEAANPGTTVNLTTETTRASTSHLRRCRERPSPRPLTARQCARRRSTG